MAGPGGTPDSRRGRREQEKGKVHDGQSHTHIQTHCWLHTQTLLITNTDSDTQTFSSTLLVIHSNTPRHIYILLVTHMYTQLAGYTHTHNSASAHMQV